MFYMKWLHCFTHAAGPLFKKSKPWSSNIPLNGTTAETLTGPETAIQSLVGPVPRWPGVSCSLWLKWVSSPLLFFLEASVCLLRSSSKAVTFSLLLQTLINACWNEFPCQGWKCMVLYYRLLTPKGSPLFSFLFNCCYYLTLLKPL